VLSLVALCPSLIFRAGMPLADKYVIDIAAETKDAEYTVRFCRRLLVLVSWQYVSQHDPIVSAVTVTQRPSKARHPT